MKKTWKIKINKNKFKIIPIAVKKTNYIIIGDKINLSDQGKILGLTINRTGISKHIENIVNKGKSALSDLYRFRALLERIKLHLIKAFIIPIITYPPIPLVSISKPNMKKLQTIQNKGLRFAFNEKYPYSRNSRTLDKRANLEPVNYALYNRANNILDKMDTLDNAQYTYLMNNYEGDKKYLYFKKT